MFYLKTFLANRKDKNKFSLFLYDALYAFTPNAVASFTVLLWGIFNCIIILVYLFFPDETKQGIIYEFISQTKTSSILFFNGMENKNNAVGFCYNYILPLFAFFATIKAIITIYLISCLDKVILSSKKKKFDCKMTKIFTKKIFKDWKAFFTIHILFPFICLVIFLGHKSHIGTKKYFSKEDLLDTPNIYILLSNILDYIFSLMFSFVYIYILLCIMIYISMWVVCILEQIYLVFYILFKSE